METSGLDMPEFLAVLFYLDKLRDHYQLDSFIVVVDAEYGELCLDEYPRACEQAAFADILLINKVDLRTRRPSRDWNAGYGASTPWPASTTQSTPVSISRRS